MKKKLSAITTTVLTLGLLSCFSLSAFALPDTQAFTYDTDNSPLVITTDKDSYSADEDIKVNVTFTNTSDTAVNNVSLKAQLSDGLKPKNNQSLSTFSESIKENESLSLDFVAVLDSQTSGGNGSNTGNGGNGSNGSNSGNNNGTNSNSGNSSSNGSNNNSNNGNSNSNNNSTANTTSSNTPDGKTVDTGSEVYYVIALAVTFALAVVLIIAFRNKKKGIKMMSLILCAGFISAISVVALQPVSAENVTSNTISVYKDITVNNKIYRIEATVNINSSENTDTPNHPDNFGDIIYSSNIAEYNGSIYCTRDVPNSDFITVPTNFSDWGKPFGIAFYNDRLYISYKFGGSGNSSSKLYSCNVDGSDKVELASYLYDDRNTSNPERTSYVNFIIYKGVLYSDNGNFSVVIDENADTNPDIDIKNALDYYTTYIGDGYNERKIEYNGGVYYIERDNSSDLYYLAKTNTFVMEKNGTTTRVTINFDGSLDTIQRLIGTKAYVTGYGKNESYPYGMGCLYEINIETGDYKVIDSHGAAGGGDAYFNW